MEVTFFLNMDEFRGWLENFHDKATELWIGYIKKQKGQFQTFDYPGSVETALCYGWIDGKMQSIDQYTYKIRFTPRKPRSVWSNINIKRVEQLTKAGLMYPAGQAAFEKRDSAKSGIYSFEQPLNTLLPELESELKENRKAWTFFSGSASSYKKTSIYWVMSAKQETTRLKRFKVLLDCSSAGLKIPLLRPVSGHKKPY